MVNKSDTMLEIAITKLYIKDLESLILKAEKSANKKIDERKKSMDKLKCTYETLEEAHEAYGYGEINETEFLKLQEFFENKESLIEDKSTAELYLSHLKRVLNTEKMNLEYFKKELEVANESNQDNN